MIALEADYIAEYDMVMITDQRHESTGASVRCISRLTTALYCVKLMEEQRQIGSIPAVAASRYNSSCSSILPVPKVVLLVLAMILLQSLNIQCP